jgi:hypothetical protein
MPTGTLNISKRRKAARTGNVPQGRRCRRCPFCGPWGECRDPAIKSGRCGDWVWYVLPNNKQARRLWLKPRDPRTPKQLQWRARLGAASRKFESLTDEQQDACIAAAAKLQSQPRLGSGPLTGQQYWVRKECATKSESSTRSAETAAKALQTQRISPPACEPRRRISGIPPAHRRHGVTRATRSEGKRKTDGCRVSTKAFARPQFRTPHSALRTRRGCRELWRGG